MSEQAFDTPLKGSVIKCIVKMSIPVFLGGIFQMLYNICDAIWISRINLNEPSLVGAVGLSFPIFFVIVAISNGMTVGIASFIARNSDTNSKLAVIKNMWSLLLLMTILCLTFGCIYGDDLFIFMGAEGIYLDNCLNYYYYLLPTVFLCFIGSLLIGIVQGQGVMRVYMISMALSTILNIILDPLFIFILGLGIKGAAIATVIAQCVALMYVSYKELYLLKMITLKELISNIIPTKTILKDILGISISSSLNQLIIAFSVIIINSILLYLDNNALAAFTIYGRIELLVFFPVWTISTVLITTIGQNYSKGLYQRMITFLKYGIALTCIIVCLLSCLLYWLFTYIYSIFSDVEAVLYFLQQTKILIFGIVFVSIHILVCSFFQAIGEALYTILLIMLRQIIIPFVLAVLLVFTNALSVANILLVFLISNISASLIAVVILVGYKSKLLRNKHINQKSYENITNDNLQ